MRRSERDSVMRITPAQERERQLNILQRNACDIEKQMSRRNSFTHVVRLCYEIDQLKQIRFLSPGYKCHIKILVVSFEVEIGSNVFDLSTCFFL